MPEPTNKQIESRMAAAEANIDSLGQSVRQLTHTVGDLASTTTDGFKELQRSINEGKKTTWAPFAIAVTLVLAVAGAFSSGYVRDQNRMQDDIKALNREVTQDAYRRGVVDGEMREIVNNQMRFTESQQRQWDRMNELRELVDARLDSLESRLAANETYDEQLGSRVGEIRAEQQRRTTRVYDENGND